MPLGLNKRWSPVGAPSPSPQARFIATNHANYERFTARKEASCEEVLAMVRDAHQWALAATALLEDKIERLSHCLSYQWSGSHRWSRSHRGSGSQRCSGSHRGRRSQSRGCQAKDPLVISCHRDSAKRWSQSPSPSQWRWWATFMQGRAPHHLKVALKGILASTRCIGCPFQLGEMKWCQVTISTWSRAKEGDLECLPPLEPHIQELLSGEEMSLAGVGGSSLWASMPGDPGPSPRQNAGWIQWCTHQLDKLAWWQELHKVPSHDDHHKFVQKVRASFELPKAWSHAVKVDNHHSGTLVSGERQIHATYRHTVWQSGLLAFTAPEDPSLCKGPSILGGEGPTANP